MKQINIKRRESWNPLTAKDESILEMLATGRHMDSVRVKNAIVVRSGKTAYISSPNGFTCYGCGVFWNNTMLTQPKEFGLEPKYKLLMLEALLSGAENLVLSHSSGVNQCGEHEIAEKIADKYGINNVYYSFAHFKTENPQEYLRQIFTI